MSERSPRQERQLTTCNFCSKPFREPKLLSCMDTFCRQCLEQWRSRQTESSQSLLCPTCASTTTLSANGIEGLPDNSFAVALIDVKNLHEEQATRKMSCSACSRHEDKPSELPGAVVYCIICEDKLCQTCSDAHRKLKITHDHRLVPLDEDFLSKLSAARQNKPVSCQEHSELACTLYCQQSGCRKPICLKCAVLAHKTHDYTDIAVVSEQLKKDLVEIGDSLSKRLDDFKQQLKVLQTRQNTLQDSKKTTETILDQRSDTVRSLIETRQTGIIVSVQQAHEKHMKTLKDTKKSLNTEFSDLQHAAAFGQALLKNGHDVQVCSVEHQFQQKAAKVDRRKTDALQEKNQSVRLVYRFDCQPEEASQKLDDPAVVFGSVIATYDKGKEDSVATKAESLAAAEPKQATVKKTVDEEAAETLRKPCGSSPEYVKTPIGLLKGKITGKNPVRGMALMGDKLLIVHRSASSIDVYNAHSLVSTGTIDVEGLTNPVDMAVCQTTKRIYVSDATIRVFRVKVQPDPGTVDVCEVQRKPYGLSVAPRCHILVSHPQNGCFTEFDVHWQIIRVVDTPGHTPFHAVYLEPDCYVICGGWFSSNSVSICRVDEKKADGNATAVSAHEMVGFNRPTHVGVGAKSQIYIVDSHKHRVVVTDSKLSTTLWTHNDEHTSGLYRCCLNRGTKKLYIGIENCTRDAIVLLYDIGRK